MAITILNEFIAIVFFTLIISNYAYIPHHYSKQLFTPPTRKSWDNVGYKFSDGLISRSKRKSYDLTCGSSGKTTANFLDKATNLFPVWVFIASIIGNRVPNMFVWFSPFITPALILTMTAMGMTLTVDDFRNVLANPQFVLLGFLSQYTIMPSVAYLLTKLFKLGPELSVGLILVGCAPGGTASNIVSLIAKADLPLSILMTAVSTIAAVFMTPFLVTKLAGSYVSVSSKELVLSTFNVVLIPILLGLSFNTFQPNICQKVSKITPIISVLLVSMICGTVCASNAAMINNVPIVSLLSAVICLHGLGFALGYIMARMFKR
jgi:BASS family bile acid:Na+ symporter